MTLRVNGPVIGSPVLRSVTPPFGPTMKLQSPRWRPITPRAMRPSHWCTAPG